ncbi:N-acyl-D-amino-acid deacylase family protein [Flexithrix dorotheae]|uniref:N-acyl-D-amino-acid deacylase family protein n=1 Tax=Flexithrix dorotheae TaxID=70993 RepID=UPI00037E0C04|nr:amidohydrolase family protein [Flexithrix dorotheae]
MKIISFNLILFTLLLAFSCKEEKKPTPFEILISQQTDFDVLIHRGQVVDGSGATAFAADILLKGDSIAFVGQVDTAKITFSKYIDAKGKTVSPGFIDTHAHGNPLKTPDFENFLAMGVTTISLGQDGFSPSYPNIEEWFNKIEDKGIRPNLAMFIGHGTLRQLSGINFNPDPSEEELEKMGNILEKALQAGCLGMTTGLEYTPGTYGKKEELVHLAKIVGKHDKMIMSHMRNEDDEAMENSISELLEQGKYCHVHVSHMKVVYGKGEERAHEILGILENARKEGIEVTADVYPYNASYTGIGIVFPDWAKGPNNYANVKITKKDELAAYLRQRVTKRNGPEATLLGTAPWTGKTLAQVAKESGKPFEEVLIDDIGPGGASGAYFVMNETLQETFVKDSLVMICSDGSPTGHHPRGHGTFAKVIEEYVFQKQLFSLEEAIRKMTSLSAESMGLTDRGRIEVGKKADILIFEPEKVQAKATYENPYQLAEGFDWVLINGDIKRENGQLVGERNGVILKR